MNEPQSRPFANDHRDWYSQLPADAIDPWLRSTSAPPILESKDLFYQNNQMLQQKLMYSEGLTDIRYEPEYSKFYQQYQSQQKPVSGQLPAPLQAPVVQAQAQRMTPTYSPQPNRFGPKHNFFEGFKEMDESSEEDPIMSDTRRAPHPLPNVRSSAPMAIGGTVDITKQSSSPVWKPLAAKPGMGPRGIPSRVSNPLDTPLSSSADDLLLLAGMDHLQKRGSVSESEEDYANSPIGPRSSRTMIQSPSNQIKKGITSKKSEGNLASNFQAMTISSPVPVPGLPGTTADPDNLSPGEEAKPVICRYFAAGYCSRGERCNYTHVLANATVISKPSANAVKPGFARPEYTKVADYIDEIHNLCLDQHGCRFLQKELDGGGPTETAIVFNGVINHIVDLMKDPFGNYLCQKLIEHCNDDQRYAIVRGVSSSVVQISKNMHGTRAIKRLIEHLKTPQEIAVVRDSLKGSVVALIQDLNGNHVIQKCLRKMEPVDNQFIYDAVAERCVRVATHRHGCCVLQRCIDHGTPQQKHQLVDQIKKNGVNLVQDPFGNYVVQYALDLNIPGLAYDIIEQLEGQLYRLSKQKFSSNVVEKCLKSGDPNCVKKVMHELLLEAEAFKQAQFQILDLLQDSFGNYVIQTCLSEGATQAPREYVLMVNMIAPFIHQLRNTPHSKRIYHLLNLHPNATGATTPVVDPNAGYSSPPHPGLASPPSPQPIGQPGMVHQQQPPTSYPLPIGQTRNVPHHSPVNPHMHQPQNDYYSQHIAR